MIRPYRQTDADPLELPSWQRRLRMAWSFGNIVLWIGVGLFLLLILPLPGALGRAKQRWLTMSSAETQPGSKDAPDDGNIIRSSGASGEWTMHVTHCASGIRRVFYGVSLTDQSNSSLAARIVEPETGDPHITVSIPGTDTEFTYTRLHCAVWKVDIDYNGSGVNEVDELAGHATFDCSENGAHVQGSVTLRNCGY